MSSPKAPATPRTKVRLARDGDLTAIYGIEQRSNPVPWTRQLIANELQRAVGVMLVATEGPEVVGYIACAGQADCWHVLNVAVDPGCRGRGVGAVLVDAAIAALDGRPYRRYTLEVRVSNEPAIRLYRSRGFVDCGVRPRYYSDNQEDALIMWREPAEGAA